MTRNSATERLTAARLDEASAVLVRTFRDETKGEANVRKNIHEA